MHEKCTWSGLNQSLQLLLLLLLGPILCGSGSACPGCWDVSWLTIMPQSLAPSGHSENVCGTNAHRPKKEGQPADCLLAWPLPSLPKSGAQAPLAVRGIPPGPCRPAGAARGRPAWRRTSVPAAPSKAVFPGLRFIYLSIYSSREQRGCCAGSRRGRGLYLLSASISALTSHNTAPLFVPGRDRPRSRLPRGAEKRPQFGSGTRPPATRLCPPPPTSRLRGPSLPHLVFCANPS